MTIALDSHNKWRSRLTISKPFESMPRAKTMPLMRWNDDLSVLAMRITNFCNDEAATQCVNTPHFLHVSRNTEILKYPQMVGMQKLWKDVVDAKWIMYLFSANADFVNKYPANPTTHQSQAGNIILQENTHMGCGILVRKLNAEYVHYVTCLYKESPKPGERLYQIRKTMAASDET